MKRGQIALAMLILIVAALFVSACSKKEAPQGTTGAADIKSDKDAAVAVSDVSTDISNITNELESIDSGLV